MLEKERLRSSQMSGERKEGAPDSVAEDKYYPMAPEQWRGGLLDLREYHVIKFGRVLQSLFYLLKYDREMICEPETNKLDFKLAKRQIHGELFRRMGEFTPFGPKDDEFKEYQKLSFLKRNLEGIDEEKVEEYSVVLVKLLRWLNYAIELTCDDVVDRRD